LTVALTAAKLGNLKALKLVVNLAEDMAVQLVFLKDKNLVGWRAEKWKLMARINIVDNYIARFRSGLTRWPPCGL